ncbi:MAG: hypothetical protein IIV99_05570 [Oscillospiraceae bacterium]|nr:hypothetical protein [Oscillospiraceae bacterium]
MSRTKAFFVTFGISFGVVLAGYMVLYAIVGRSVQQQADVPQQGIAALTVETEDSKTCLVVLDFDGMDFYTLVKLNAIQGKVNVVTIPQSFYLDTAQRTLGQSMEYAGVMQCVQDISRQFDVAVDCFAVCDSEGIGMLTENFRPLETAGIDVPQPVKKYLPDSGSVDADSLFAAVDYCSHTLEETAANEFVNVVLYRLVSENIDVMHSHLPDAIKHSFSQINTDIGTTQLSRLKRIAALLGNVGVYCDRLVLSDTESAQAQVDRVLKE